MDTAMQSLVTGWLLCQWYVGQSGANLLAVVQFRILTYRSGSGTLALAKCPRLQQAINGSKWPVFLGNSAIILLVPYPFATLRPLSEILSSFDNILLICLLAHVRHAGRKRYAHV